MKDATFYQALNRCFINNKDCLRCCLYAAGHCDNGLCIRMLEEEIRIRKQKAHEDEDRED